MVGSQLGASLVFSIFVLIGNPLIVLIIMGLMGYRRRTGFLAGLTVAQISEFSLIVAALGMSIGHITEETVGLITLVGVVTIFLSTYMILYSYPLYRMLSSPLKIFERRNPYRESAIDTPAETEGIDAVLVGLGNYGSGLMEHLLRRQYIVVGIDFDPEILNTWRKRGVPVLYGDIADPEMHEQLPLKKTQWVISTVRSQAMNLALIHNLKREGYTGKVALTATNDQEAAGFEKAGANLVFRPFMDAAEQAADALTHAMDFLPESVNWPVSFLELRIRSDASAAGRTIQELPLSASGISVLAVSRGGRIFHEPKPDFRIFPGDRLLLMGPPGELKHAESILNQLEMQSDTEDTDRFEIAEIKVSKNSKLSGKTVADLHFRQQFGATLAGIRRNQEQITTINPEEHLLGGDCLIVIGKSGVVQELKKQSPL
jgi:Trk K+ transport system NAD-binding subunit